jgi:hypothetical protein
VALAELLPFEASLTAAICPTEFLASLKVYADTVANRIQVEPAN